MMHFIAFPETTQNADRIFDRGLLHVNRLKAPFKCGVFFYMLAIFVEGRRSDAAELAASQRGFEHIRSVHRSFGRSSADQRMQFVDEKNDPTFRS